MKKLIKFEQKIDYIRYHFFKRSTQEQKLNFEYLLSIHVTKQAVGKWKFGFLCDFRQLLFLLSLTLPK